MPGVSHQEKVASETYFGWVWSVVFLVQSDYMILWSSISLGRIAYSLWFFVDGGSHQVRIACERSSFDWMWLVVPLIQSDCRILRLSISVERIKWYCFCICFFFCLFFVVVVTVVLRGDSHQRKLAPETTKFGWLWYVVSLI